MVGTTAKGMATRQSILRSAGRVFAARGFTATRMEEIIAASGVAKGAIYFHFSSKEDLARSIVADQKERWLALTTEIADEHTSPLDQLDRIGSTLIDLMSSDDTAWSVVRLSAELPPADDAANPLSDWIDFITDLIRRGQATGSIAHDGDARDLATVIVGAFDGLKTVSDSIPGSTPQSFRRQAELLLSAIRRSLA